MSRDGCAECDGGGSSDHYIFPFRSMDLSVMRFDVCIGHRLKIMSRLLTIHGHLMIRERKETGLFVRDGVKRTLL